jgi:transposase
MRGEDENSGKMFSYVSAERRIPADHPLRAMRQMVDGVLKELSGRFDGLYARVGRPSIAPEKLLRALLIQILYSVRRERLLMEQLDYNLLFRWFVGLEMDDAVWDATVFTKNRERLLEGDIAGAFFEKVIEEAKRRGLLSDEHFTVDGTQVEAWAGQKSFKRKDGSRRQPPPDDRGNPTINFRGEKRGNETHRSTTDPDARLFTKLKGNAAKLCYIGNVLTENRSGLVVDTLLTQATGYGERSAAVTMLARAARRHAQHTPTSGERGHAKRITAGADRGYDTRDFVLSLRQLEVTPHVAQNTTKRSSRIDERTTRHPGYEISQRKRKRIEEVFGWIKTVGLMRKTRHRGSRRVGWMFTFTAAVYNLVRMRNLAAAVT